MVEIERVIAEFGPVLGRVAATYTSPHADRDDLLQEIAMALLTALPKYRGDSSLHTYVFRIAHNCGNALVMRRLNDPSSVEGVDFEECKPLEQYRDGRPASRHTYDGMVLVPELDKIYTFAGAGVPCGYSVQYTWLLDLSAIESAQPGQAAPWQNMNPARYPSKAGFGLVADYDAAGKRVILNDGYNLWSYDPAANLYTLLNDSNATNAHIDYHMTGRVDPKRKLFIVVGGGAAADGGMKVFDIGEGSDYAQQNWTRQVEGCAALLAAESPGFAYDDSQDRFVGWAGGDDVFIFDRAPSAAP